MNAQSPVHLFPQAGYTPFIKEIASPGARVDVIGDIHGCFDELVSLLEKAGWIIGSTEGRDGPIPLAHPGDRHLVFLGDLIDRGPGNTNVLRLAMGGAIGGVATTIMGNHDWKMLRYLAGNPVKLLGSAMVTAVEIAELGEAFVSRVIAFYQGSPHQVRIALPEGHARSGDGALTLVHGAARSHRQDRADKESFERSIYGYATGETDAAGGLVRLDWSAGYDGPRGVIHGHTPVRTPEWRNRVLCIDTGCVFGNALTLYRVDEDRLIQVPALRNHSGKTRIWG